jgi:hypothetical protein
MKKLQLNIFDTDLVWMGMIEEVESLILRSSWHEIVHSEMKVRRNAQGVEELKIGRILVVNNDREKALIIEDMSTALKDNFWTFTLTPLKGMLNYRICHPSDTGAFSQYEQSEVMMIIPYNNLVSQTRDPDRKFWDSTRTKNMFGVTDLKVYGDTIDFTVDWNTGYMGDTIVSIAKMYSAGKYPVGWNVYISSSWDSFHMDTYLATNRTINQTVNNPVVFSEEYGNIKNATYTYSIKDWRNVVYMSWTNGTTPTNTPVGNTTHGATVSFNRKELIVDSSKKISTEVQNEGKSELNKRPHVESFTAEIINNPNTMSTYGEHWDLGDIVTIQSKAIKKDEILSIDAQITEIEEIYENGEYNINATFGEGKLTLIQLIKNAINKY